MMTMLVVFVCAEDIESVMIEHKEECMSVQVSFRGTDGSREVALISALNILKGNDGGGPIVNDSSQTCLPLDDRIRDTHLSA